jgi:hypothetical protein
LCGKALATDLEAVRGGVLMHLGTGFVVVNSAAFRGRGA